jgi:hypothetical protein
LATALPTIIQEFMRMKRLFPLTIGTLLLGSLILAACNKLDTTDLGSNLIPQVDNVNTFADTLPVNVTQGFFNDTPTVASGADFPLGTIGLAEDPVFGKTTASLYAELKPNLYPYSFGNKDSIVGFDSVLLTLAYTGFYGDSTVAQRLQVRTITSSDMRDDTTYSYRNRPAGLGPVIGSATIQPAALRNWIKFTNGRDSVRNQIRIRITDNAFLNALYNRDTTVIPGNNAFRSDSTWKLIYKGFGIITDSTFSGKKGLFYCNLTNPLTRLEVHYRIKNAGRIDTGFASFGFAQSVSGATRRSGFMWNIARTYAGAEISNPAADAAYIQAGPGTYANVEVPALTGMTNRIVHRAELILEQVPGAPAVDTIFSAPAYLYMDLIDTGTNNFRPIPYDLNPDIGYPIYPGLSNFNFGYFGGFRRFKQDAFGKTINYYTFNVSRHVQGIVTRKEPVYKFRVYAPFQLDYTRLLGIFGKENFFNAIALGRVKLGSGTNANYRMRMRIVYSKI